MHESPDSNLVSRIAMQQFSLNNLLNLMLNYNNEFEVAEYIILLKKLKQAYDESNIAFTKGSLYIDTTTRRILLARITSYNVCYTKLLRARAYVINSKGITYSNVITFTTLDSAAK